MMLESIENGPLVYPTIEENGLLPDVYSLVNHHQAAKDIWDRVNLLMKGTELSYQERECKLYNEFDKFTSVNARLGEYKVSERSSTRVEQGQSFAGTRTKGKATRFGGNNFVGKARVVKCYNCQGKGHMARQCTQPKRPRNYAWFKEKMLLVQAQESGQLLDKEQLSFLEDT
uniref:Retrovirus-related Pol polyprotein from transposon TNT 1-94 n=1 Tax=Tanacetum cinerariifolium TaxID=118510 RepID=A0A699L1V9_TANCI|nr:retrovirus-related Pol polyprotein from transposon TNT 1-94 [Tanacetum cinerariifolium]